MQRISLTAAALLATLAAVLPVQAVDTGMKPGLWESKSIKLVVDGRDMSEQMAAMMAKRDQMMAALPAEQRAKMEAMFKSNGIGQGNDGFQICVSPAMAKRDTPVIDKEGRCQPVKLTRTGNQTSFEINCAVRGVTTTGKGVSTIGSDTISTQVDMTTTNANAGGKTQVIHSESEMHFVGPDCGDLKPPDALAPQS
jgi:Tfp pilus assembly protein PilV